MRKKYRHTETGRDRYLNRQKKLIDKTIRPTDTDRQVDTKQKKNRDREGLSNNYQG